MKLRIVFSFALPLCLAGGLFAEVNAPKLGIARYADRTAYSIYGLESNLLVNAQLLSSADTLSFSDSGGLVAIGGRIQLMTLDGAPVGEYESTEAAPVLNIDGALTTAIAWLPSLERLVYWNGSAFVVTQLVNPDMPGKVSSVQASGTTAAKLLANDQHGNVFAISVSLETGQVLSVDLLPGVKGPAFQQYSFVVSHDANGLHVTGANGVVRTLPLTAPDLTFERMSSDWLHLASATTGQDWALHLSPGTLHLSQLPAPQFQRRMSPRPLQPKEQAR